MHLHIQIINLRRNQAEWKDRKYQEENKRNLWGDMHDCMKDSMKYEGID